MNYSKKLYGKTIIDSSDSEDFDENRKIELEYYETENDSMLSEENKPYGLEIVKKNLLNEEIDVENKVINNVYFKQQDIDKLLDILIECKVTPISVDEIIEDLKISLE